MKSSKLSPKLTPTFSLMSDKFSQALLVASSLHASQARKGGEVPYIAHLLAVCALVLEAGGEEDLAIAALLHDAVEDQGGESTLLIIRQRFGDRVADVVNGCTDTDETPKPPWKQRKQDYLDHLRSAPDDVRLVSAADKVHNARSILFDYRTLEGVNGEKGKGHEVWQRFHADARAQLWYYRELVAALQVGESQGPTKVRPLFDELHRLVSEMEKLRPLS